MFFFSQKEMRKLSVAQYPISEIFLLENSIQRGGVKCIIILSSKSFPKTECFVLINKCQGSEYLNIWHQRKLLCNALDKIGRWSN